MDIMVFIFISKMLTINWEKLSWDIFRHIKYIVNNLNKKYHLNFIFYSAKYTHILFQIYYPKL